MPTPQVILIGGAPLTGKTTVALRLASRLNYSCISTDDIGAALAAMTTPQSHPALHPSRGQDFREYVLSHSLSEIIDHMQGQHQAMWPAVEAVVREHATWRGPAVIEGYALRPQWFAQMRLPSVGCLWLATDEQTLRHRLREDQEYMRYVLDATDPSRLVEQFVARSLWYNQMIVDNAHSFNMPVVRTTLTSSVDTTCQYCLDLLNKAELASQPEPPHRSQSGKPPA